MKFLLLLLLLLPSLAFSQTLTTWTESRYIGFNADNNHRPWLVFNTTVYPPGSCPGFDGTVHAIQPCNFAPDTWVNVSMVQYGIPADAKEIFVQGLLIITPGNTGGPTEVWFQCRAPGSAIAGGAYNAQTLGRSPDIGQRSTAAMWCPVKDGMAQFLWHWSGPVDSAYGVSMASNYNARPRPVEVMVDGTQWAVISAREQYSDLVRRETVSPEWRDLP